MPESGDCKINQYTASERWPRQQTLPKKRGEEEKEYKEYERYVGEVQFLKASRGRCKIKRGRRAIRRREKANTVLRTTGNPTRGGKYVKN